MFVSVEFLILRIMSLNTSIEEPRVMKLIVIHLTHCLLRNNFDTVLCNTY